MSLKTYKIDIPLENGDIFNLDININFDSPEIQNAMTRLSYAYLLHDKLKKLIEEMAPVALIYQSEAYQEAVELLGFLEDKWATR